MSKTGPITREEMIEMFGEAMPMEAVALVWDTPGEMTLGEVRARLREIAATPKAITLSDRLRSEAVSWSAPHTVTGPRLAKLLCEAADEIDRLVAITAGDRQ